MDNDLIYKSFNTGFEEINDEYKYVLSYVSTPDVDRSNEIVLTDGIDYSDFDGKVFYNHRIEGFPIGKCSDELKKTEKGLLARTQFAGTKEGRDSYLLCKEDVLNAWSIGFYPIKYHYDNLGRKVFDRVKLVEYSLVALPDNPKAKTISFIKSLQSDKFKNKLMEEYNNEMSLMMKSFESRLAEYDDKLKNINVGQVIPTETITSLEDKSNQLNEALNQFEMRLKIAEDYIQKEVKKNNNIDIQNLVVKKLNEILGK